MVFQLLLAEGRHSRLSGLHIQTWHRFFRRMPFLCLILFIILNKCQDWRSCVPPECGYVGKKIILARAPLTQRFRRTLIYLRDQVRLASISDSIYARVHCSIVRTIVFSLTQTLRSNVLGEYLKNQCETALGVLQH